MHNIKKVSVVILAINAVCNMQQNRVVAGLSNTSKINNVIKSFTPTILSYKLFNNRCGTTTEEIYKTGTTTHEKENYSLMEKCYILAIKNNHAQSANNLGNYYFKLNDYNKAIEYFKKAIDLGDKKEAANNLAICYKVNFEKNNKVADYDNMLKYYQMAIDNGVVDSITNLGNYYYGVGDYTKAIEYYELAVEKGDSRAALNLGNYYNNLHKNNNSKLPNHLDNLNINVNKMIMYYELAIKLGDSGASNNLAVYYHSIGNHINAVHYYQMAIKCGNSDSALNLGVYYYENADYDNTEKYFKLADEMGNPKAKEYLEVLQKITNTFKL